jgi:hypothetical protein
VRRSPWLARAALLATAAPLVVSVVTTTVLLRSDETVRAGTGVSLPTPLGWRDRWSAVLLHGGPFDDPLQLAVLTTLGCLALALATTGAPVAPPVRHVRRTLPWLAVAGAAWAVATVAVTGWFQVTASPADDGTVLYAYRLPALGWTGALLTSGPALLAVGVAAAVVLWCRVPGSDEGVLQDAGERARAE